MADMKQLYQEVILDHNRKPRNWGVLADATHRAEGHNPLCGDHLTLTLKLRDEAVDAINFQGESCAICKASASMMTMAVKGKSSDDAEQLVQEFRDLATGKLDAASPHHLSADRAAKLAKLDEMFLNGQVSEETYKEMKARLQG